MISGGDHFALVKKFDMAGVYQDFVVRLQKLTGWQMLLPVSHRFCAGYGTFGGNDLHFTAGNF